MSKRNRSNSLPKCPFSRYVFWLFVCLPCLSSQKECIGNTMLRASFTLVVQVCKSKCCLSSTLMMKTRNSKIKQWIHRVFYQVSLPALWRAWTLSKYSFTLSWIPSSLDPAMPAYIRAWAASYSKKIPENVVSSYLLSCARQLLRSSPWQ